MNLAVYGNRVAADYVMKHVHCVIKRDVYPHKMHSCSKNIRGISRKNRVIGCHCMGIAFVERYAFSSKTLHLCLF